MSSSGVVRVTIPINLRKTIQDIKEIASKHSEEDIYAMLKECNMDPNETAQKLLYLDTFHEVKRKRDRKGPNVTVHAPQRHRWTSGMQRRGGGSRGRNYSTYVSDDTGGRRQVSAGRENEGVDHMERSLNGLAPVHHNNASSHAITFLNGSPNGSTSPSDRGSTPESNPNLSCDNVPDVNEGKTADNVSKSGKKDTLPTIDVKQLQALNPGPTPTPTLGSGASFEGRDSGVYSSASDPVLVPSLNPRNPGAMGAIKRETGSQRTAPDFSGLSLQDSGLNAGQDVVNDSQVAQRVMISADKTSQGVEKNHNSEASRPSSLLDNANSYVSITNQDNWSPQQVNGATKLMTSEGEAVVLQDNAQSFPKVSDAALEQPTLQLEIKLEKLSLSSHQPVVFPDHIQVPEAYRNGLTFGSLDDILVHNKNDSQDSKDMDESVMTNEDASRQPSLSHQTISSIARESDLPGHPQSSPHVPENLSPLGVNIQSGAPSKSDQSKPELVQPIGASQYPFLHAVPDYSFGFMPPMLGPHFVQVEGAEAGNSSIPSTSGSSQPPAQTVGVGQSSVAVSPQLYPFLRQPYLSNYFPYNPFLPQIYMPHNAQFLGHGGFPQQASTGNIYMPPAAAPTGVKFPVPPMYKPGTLATNLTHFGIPSAYGSYGSSAINYGLSATVTPGSSASSEDLPAPELKEKNIYPTLNQNEESHVWTSAPGRDLSALQANFFYNFPQGQQVAFSPAHSGQGSLAGMYHITTAAAPLMGQSLPQHSQTMSPSVETVVPPSGTYQQPHSQINWNTKLLNRENI